MRIVTPSHLYGHATPLIRPAGQTSTTSDGKNLLILAGAAVVLAFVFYSARPKLRLPGYRSAIMPPAPRRKRRR